MIYDLIIIGAGAAGLFAAANAPFGWKTLVLEKTEKPGQKLLLTGSGQCNLTNNESIKAFLLRYGDKGKLLRSVLFPFSNIALMEYFEQHGLPLLVREDGKVFPKSMKSADVLSLLLDISKKRDVAFNVHVGVQEINYHSESELSRFSLQTTNGEFFSKNILIATGGASYPKTGSDGSFLACLEHFGLSLVSLRPALTPILVHEYPFSNLSGLTFSKAVVEINNSKTPQNAPTQKAEGSLLFTHKGFSGPAILQISRYVTQGDSLIINYLPEFTKDSIYKKLMQTAAGDSRQIITVLESATNLPRRFLEFICANNNIAKNEKASRLSGREMDTLAKQLTADSYEVSGTGGFSEAMTTAGGVSLDEIDLRRMEAKNYPGLFFAGEVLDVDGDTGGYNLQFAFSSAICSTKAMQAARPVPSEK